MRPSLACKLGRAASISNDFSHTIGARKLARSQERVQIILEVRGGTCASWRAPLGFASRSGHCIICEVPRTARAMMHDRIDVISRGDRNGRKALTGAGLDAI